MFIPPSLLADLYSDRMSWVTETGWPTKMKVFTEQLTEDEGCQEMVHSPSLGPQLD